MTSQRKTACSPYMPKVLLVKDLSLFGIILSSCPLFILMRENGFHQYTSAMPDFTDGFCNFLHANFLKS